MVELCARGLLLGNASLSALITDAYNALPFRPKNPGSGGSFELCPPAQAFQHVTNRSMLSLVL